MRSRSDARQCEPCEKRGGLPERAAVIASVRRRCVRRRCDRVRRAMPAPVATALAVGRGLPTHPAGAGPWQVLGLGRCWALAGAGPWQVLGLGRCWALAGAGPWQVLGLALGDRTDEMVARAWAQVPTHYQSRPVFTDHWGAYTRLLPSGQHFPCDKGSGLTSIVESLSTKWRQHQSGLVRRSCGVHPKRETDPSEKPTSWSASCCWWRNTTARAHGTKSAVRTRMQQQRRQIHSLHWRRRMV